MASEKTPTQELSDLLYAFQIQIKLIEDLFISYSNGSRDDKDFSSRFDSQANLLANNLKKVKPLVETIFKNGYDIINQMKLSQDLPYEQEVMGDEQQQ
jgi:DNA polymerase sigma